MSKTKVFYVEDELFLARIVKESLESRGFEVIMESDGAKATDLSKDPSRIFVSWISCFPIRMVLPLLMRSGKWMKMFPLFF